MAALDTTLNIIAGSWITGPIFGKELRVASRRKMTYVFRTLYLVILIGVLGLTSASISAYVASSAVTVARMSEIGRGLTMVVAWIQFIAAQILAGILLSTAINDEVNRRTLGILLTAPITSLQIVAGKLFGALCQVLILVAVSLPAMAVIRVFGGVPWQFLLAAISITASTALFIGSLSLVFSILCRHAYTSVLLTVLTTAALFLVLPLLMLMLFDRYLSNAMETWLLFHFNPYVALAIVTEGMMNPRWGGMVPQFAWCLHCGIFLALALALLLFCTALVRRAARRQLVGAAPRRRRIILNRSIRTPWGPPMAWKELKAPLLGRRPIITVIVLGLFLAMVLPTYIYWADEGVLDNDGVHIAYGMIYMVLGLLCTVVYAATGVTTEKESRTWSGLLCTTMTDRQIIWGKLAGVAWRCLPAWSPLLAHVWIFAMFGYIHPIALLQVPFIVFWSWAIVAGAGLYFSVRFRRTTTAVVVNVVLFAALWLGLTFILAMIGLSAGSGDLVELYVDALPFMHLGVTLEAAVNESLGTYGWESWGRINVWASTLWMLFVGGMNILVGYLFIRMARERLRKSAY